MTETHGNKFTAAPVKGMGDWLVEVHDWLRQQLDQLRRQVDNGVRPELGAQMREHCRAFCGALERHHVGEDRGVFPGLAHQFPELQPALDKLAEEHQVVARLQAEIQRLAADDPQQLRNELDRLAAELEAHFRYEEETIVEALNATGPAPDWS